MPRRKKISKACDGGNKTLEMEFPACVKVISMPAHPTSFVQNSPLQQTVTSFRLPFEQEGFRSAEENESCSVAKSLTLTTKDLEPQRGK